MASAAGITEAALFNGCALSRKSSLANVPFDRTPVVETARPLKIKLREVVASLAPSPIRDLLLSKALYYYQNPRPKVVGIGAGVEIQIYNATVEQVVQPSNTVDVTKISYAGNFNFRDPGNVAGIVIERLYPTKDEAIKIPISVIPDEEDLKNAVSGNIAQDGTPLLEVDFDATDYMLQGVSPAIRLFVPRISTISGDRIERLIRFILLKEASQLLLCHVWLEETAKKMEALCLPRYVRVKLSDGSEGVAEILTSAFVNLMNYQGRFVAGLDSAGLALAFKALEGTDIANEFANSNPQMGAIAVEIEALSLGTTQGEILRNSLRWGIDSQAAGKVFRAGDVKKFP